MKPRYLAILGAGMGLVGGGITATIAGMPGQVGASSPVAYAVSDDGSTTTVTPDSTTTDSTTTDSTTTDDTTTDDTTTHHGFGEAKPDRGARLTEALQPLIDDGTITQAQADEVIAALEAAGPSAVATAATAVRVGSAATSPGSGATALGISTDDLRTALQDGKSIADVAAEQGVDVQTVIDAMVSEASTRIDEAVTAGKLTAEEAATRKAELTERITEAVNTAGGLGRGPGHGPGMGGPRGERPSDDAAPTDGSTVPAPEASTPDTTTGG